MYVILYILWNMNNQEWGIWRWYMKRLSPEVEIYIANLQSTPLIDIIGSSILDIYLCSYVMPPLCTMCTYYIYAVYTCYIYIYIYIYSIYRLHIYIYYDLHLVYSSYSHQKPKVWGTNSQKLWPTNDVSLAQSWELQQLFIFGFWNFPKLVSLKVLFEMIYFNGFFQAFPAF